MTKERQLEILMMDGCTKHEAEKYLKQGTIIFDGDDFEKNFDSYMDEWHIDDEDDLRAEFRAMLGGKKLISDWGYVKEHDSGKTYYIQY